MPTLSEYQNVAPDVAGSGNLNEASMEARFAGMPSEPSIPSKIPLTNQQKEDLFNDMTIGSTVKKSVDLAGGLNALARKHGADPDLTHDFCDQVEKALLLYLSSL